MTQPTHTYGLRTRVLGVLCALFALFALSNMATQTYTVLAIRDTQTDNTVRNKNIEHIVSTLDTATGKAAADKLGQVILGAVSGVDCNTRKSIQEAFDQFAGAGKVNLLCPVSTSTSATTTTTLKGK